MRRVLALLGLVLCAQLAPAIARATPLPQQFLVVPNVNVQTGVATSVTVSAWDGVSVVTNYTGTVQLTSGDENADLPASYTFTPADQGVHVFQDLTFCGLGSQTLTASDGTRTGETLVPVTLGPVSEFTMDGPETALPDQ